VTEQAERYDRIAAGYARWWAPVLVPRATALLERLEPAIAAGARRLVDIGTGSGTLAVAAIRRWPQVEVVGIDASRGMAELAEDEASRQLGRADRRRFDVRVAFADDLPFDDEAFDAAMSSFVFQLVPNRARALREARRVLAPGGALAWVTWLQDARVFRPDIEFDAALDEIGVGAREDENDGRPGDLPSVEAAVAQTRRAGFRDVRGERSMVEHPFGVEGYVRFMTEFDEEDLVSSLSDEERRTLLEDLRARLSRLSAEDLTLRLPVVSVTGIRR
jgi:ubiquinone/menaquinone biosynthesis C-methylase UbiE